MAKRLLFRHVPREAVMKTAETIGDLIICCALIYGGVNLVLMGAAVVIGYLHP